jgi:DNA-binding transcriptional ArsR family regulator
MTKQRQPESASLPRGTYTVTELGQIRALADPLRLRILGELSGVPRTTKQVAERLGEKPTKLYHHVEALARVGLIRLTGTRPNRGTVERYYQAVAAMFQVAASALSPPAAGGEPPGVEAMLTSILDTARAELLAHVRAAPTASRAADRPVVGRVLIRGPLRKLRAVRRRLLRLIEHLRPDEAEGAAKAGEATYALTVVLCPAEPPAG